jgi:hypothetical protein
MRYHLKTASYYFIHIQIDLFNLFTQGLDCIHCGIETPLVP